MAKPTTEHEGLARELREIIAKDQYGYVNAVKATSAVEWLSANADALLTALSSQGSTPEGDGLQEMGVASGPGCQPTASAPDGSSQSGIPNADEKFVPEWLSRELAQGIANLKEALSKTERADLFWSRYWDGYLKGYESLLVMTLAQTIEARSDETRSGSARQGESVVGEADAPKGE